MHIYRQLAENVYTLFEVESVDLGRGLALKDVLNKKRYYVNEISATYGLKIGDLFFNRVAMVGDKYELVGSDSHVISMQNGKDSDEFKKDILKHKDRIDPSVIALGLFIKHK